MNHLYEDAGVFIGLTTTPTNTSDAEYYQSKFKGDNGLFNKIRSNIIKNSPNELPVQVYDDKAYSVFGDHDLAIISLHYDFSLGSYHFHPLYKKEHHDFEEFSFDFQTITGFVPKFQNSKSLFENWDNIFTNKQLPFLGITKIKINSGFTIGVGKKMLSVVSRLIKYEVEKMVGKTEDDTSDLEFILIETFCSFEFTVLIFSNSFSKIKEIIFSIRENSFLSMKTKLKSTCKTDDDTEELDKIISQIEDKSLIKNWINDTKDLPEDNNAIFESSHIFASTFTYFAYGVDLFENKNKYYNINLQDTSSFFIDFEVKPGYLKRFLEKLLEYYHKTEGDTTNNFNIYSRSGNGLIAIDTKEFTKDGFTNPYVLFDKYKDSEEACYTPKSNILNDVYKFKTTLSHNNLSNEALQKLDIVNDNHLFLHKRLNALSVNVVQVKRLKKYMNMNKISKILQLRIIKMFSLYENGIEDRILYSYFIILKDYLDHFVNILEDLSENKNKSQDQKHIIVSYLIDSFEKAYKNRFHQSHRTKNSTDDNLEYSGGIQQIIEAYSSIYRILFQDINAGAKFPIVHVTGFHGIDSSLFDLRLNYSHVFTFQFFLSIIIKEAANFHLPWTLQNFSDKMNTDQKNIINLAKKSANNFDLLESLRHDLYRLAQSHKEENKVVIINQISYSINDKLFNYIFADYANYTYGYFLDYDLYCYWSFSSFLQNPHFFENKKGNSINTELFILLLVRLLIISKVIEDEDSKSYLNAFKEYLPNEAIILVDKYYDIINEIVEVILDNTKVTHFISYIKREAYSIFQKMHAKIKVNIPKNVANSNRKPFEYNYYRWERISDDIIQEYETENCDYLDLLNNGKIIEFDSEVVSYELYILKLCYFSLRRIKELNNDKIYLLERNNNGSEKKSVSKAIKTKIINDPLSGIFVYDIKKNQELFKISCSVLNSLIDFSHKWKKDLF